MGISDGDIARLISACIYILISVTINVVAIALYRHNLTGRSKEYMERYKNYINSLCLLACGGFFLAVGNVVSLIDQGETPLPEEGRESQWGWWIGFTLFLASTLMAISKYHRLTNFEELTALLMAASTGATFIFLSLSGSSDGRILWTVLLFVSIGVVHFFIFWASQRVYALSRARQDQGYTRYFGHLSLDIGLILVSAGMAVVVGLTLTLGPESYDVISSDIATESMYAGFLGFYYVIAAIMIFYGFMDINDQIPKGQVVSPDVSQYGQLLKKQSVAMGTSKLKPSLRNFGKLPKKLADMLDQNQKQAASKRRDSLMIPSPQAPIRKQDIVYV
jgi:hypothetical protein